MAALGNSVVVSLLRARSLSSDSGMQYWLRHLKADRLHLRGMHRPTTTGRWSLRDLPLHSLPKRGSDGQSLRSGLLAPSGFVLVGADWNAFESRLLASLSGDSTLLQAARSEDMHVAMSRVLFGSGDRRSLAKAGLYGVVYGQTEASFWRKRHEIR
jgi:DNA polymerase I